VKAIAGALFYHFQPLKLGNGGFKKEKNESAKLSIFTTKQIIIKQYLIF